MTLKEMRQTRRAGLLNVKSRTFKCEGERNDHMLHYEQVFGNVSERRKSKFSAVLMKHHRKIKGGQVITLQMVQQLKTKNINVILGQVFCRQCKAKFLLEADSLKNFNLLQRLTMNSLYVKLLGKNSNQLAFYLPAYTHL